jgi:hypothetical protein
MQYTKRRDNIYLYLQLERLWLYQDLELYFYNTKYTFDNIPYSSII